MTTERWARMYQILTAIERMNNRNEITTVRCIKEYIQKKEPDIDINIINSSIRHYRKNGLIKRKHNPYVSPFQYILTLKGEEQLDWLENKEYLDYCTY